MLLNILLAQPEPAQMSGQQIAALIIEVLVGLAAIVAAIRAGLAKLQAELAKNTKTTEEVKGIAEAAAEQMDYKQKYTAASLELDDARRRLGLVASLPDCLDCRARIAAVLAERPGHRRRTDAPATGETTP